MTSRTAARRPFPMLLALAGLAGGCDRPGAVPGSGGGGPEVPTPACTGTVPANATLCPGSASDLASDAPRVVVGSSCACPAPCTPTPCAYVCDAGYALGVDGTCAPAVAGPPSVQFTDNGDGTVAVVDDLGRATWLRDANCTEGLGGVVRAGGAVAWNDAVAWSAALADGACGLRDGSVAGAWRLPTQVQLMHLQVGLAGGSPFTGIQAGTYWSSWTYWADKAGAVDLYTGTSFEFPKTSLFYAWPVRQ